MDAVNPKIGFYFMNGMLNEDKDGSSTTGVIQQIIQNSVNFQTGNAFVAFHYNDAAPTERVLKEVSFAAAGAIATGWSIKKEMEKKGDRYSRLVGFAGIACIAGVVPRSATYFSL